MILQAFLLLAGVLLTALPISMLLANVCHSSFDADRFGEEAMKVVAPNDQDSSGIPTTFNEKPANASTSPSDTELIPGFAGAPSGDTISNSSATLSIRIRRIMPEDRKLVATFTLWLPAILKERIRDSQSGDQVVAPTGRSLPELLLKPEYEDQMLNLRVREQDDPTGSARLGESILTIVVPLNDLFPGSGYPDDAGVFSADGEISSITQVDAYPSDWYGLDAMAEVELPYPLIVGDGGGLFLPLTVFVHSTSEMAGRAVTVFQQPQEASAFQPLQLVVERDWMQKLYVYVSAAMPLILAGLLLIGVLKQSSRPNRYTGNMIGVAAAFLAVLPLRTVLVPNELPGLTRVDYILAIALALLVGAMLTSVGIGTFKFLPAEQAAPALASHHDNVGIRSARESTDDNNRAENECNRLLRLSVLWIFLAIAVNLAKRLLTKLISRSIQLFNSLRGR